MKILADNSFKLDLALSSHFSLARDFQLGHYDYFIPHGMQTIITINLTSEQIEKPLWCQYSF